MLYTKKVNIFVGAKGCFHLQKQLANKNHTINGDSRHFEPLDYQLANIPSHIR